MIRHAIVGACLVAAAAAPGSPLPEYPFISVQGEAATNVPPNIATITLRVSVLLPDPAKAAELLQTRSVEILRILAALAIPNEDIAAHEIEKEFAQVHRGEMNLASLLDDGSDGKDKSKGYRLSRTIKITLRELSKYDGVLTPVLAMQNVELNRTDFDRTDRAAIEAELIARACDNARTEALALAHGFHAALGPLKAVSKQGFRNLGELFGLGDIEYRSTRFSRTEPVSTLFVPATIALEAYVAALFELGGQK